MEIIKEKIITNKYPKDILANALMEGDIIVPDVKPDAAEIIWYNPKGAVTEAEAVGGKINFKGRLSLAVIYLPKGEEKRPACLRTDLTLTDFIPAELPPNCALLCGSFDITDSLITVINDRKIHYRLSLSLSFQALSQSDSEIITDIKDMNQDLKLFKSFKNFAPSHFAEETFKISEEFTLPGDRDEIGEIFDVDIMLRGVEPKLSGDRLNLAGDLSLKILYRPTTSDEIEILEYELPINGAFETNNKDKNAICRLNLCLLSYSVNPADDDDGEARRLCCAFTLRASYIILSEYALTALDDAYIPGKETSAESDTLELTAFVCRNKNQFPVKETVELEPDAPPILRICSVLCRPVCDKIETFPDKITAEGMVEAKILYTAKDDAHPLCCCETLLPYRQSIEMKGLNPKANPDIAIDLRLEHLSFSTLDSREVELKPVLSICAAATESQEVRVLKDISFSDLSEEVLGAIPSMTLCIVKPGDNLRKIAKSHNTTVSAIIKINNLSSAEDIAPSQKLIILKNN